MPLNIPNVLFLKVILYDAGVVVQTFNFSIDKAEAG